MYALARERETIKINTSNYRALLNFLRTPAHALYFFFIYTRKVYIYTIAIHSHVEDQASSRGVYAKEFVRCL